VLWWVILELISWALKWAQDQLCMLGRTKDTTKFVIIHESNFTDISNFEMAVTSKRFQIHI
jgi:hypothetical protein